MLIFVGNFIYQIFYETLILFLTRTLYIEFIKKPLFCKLQKNMSKPSLVLTLDTLKTIIF